MFTFTAPTLTDLHTQMCESLIRSPADRLSVISNVDVQQHNVMGYAESLEWDFDLKSMWLTPSRWTMMIRQYLDPEEVQAWIERCTGTIGTKGRGIAVLRTKTVKPRGGAATGHTNKETRRWGSCMLAVSYKAKPTPQITLHSRTSYLGYIGALDLTVAWMLGRYLSEAMGIPLSSISFLWMNEAIQWHNFKSMAYMLNNPDPQLRRTYRRVLTKKLAGLEPEEVALLGDSPAIHLTRDWLKKVRIEDARGLTYGDMNYNTYRRIRRRWHTEVFGYEHAQQFEGWSVHKRGPNIGENKEFFKAYQPLPSTPVQGLDFKGIGMPIGQVSKWGVDYDPSADVEEDEDE